MAAETPRPLNMILLADAATHKDMAVAVAQTLGIPGTDKGTTVEVGMHRGGAEDGDSTWVFAPSRNGKDSDPGVAVISRTPDVIVTDVSKGLGGKFRIETGRIVSGDLKTFPADVRRVLSQPAGKNGR